VLDCELAVVPVTLIAAANAIVIDFMGTSRRMLKRGGRRCPP
jgi:hypothetical protein